MRTRIFSFAALALCVGALWGTVSCRKEPPIQAVDPQAPASLRVTLNVQDLQAGIQARPQTRAEGEHDYAYYDAKAQDSSIGSLAFFLVADDPSDPRIVAYRLIVKGDALGDKYFYQNNNNRMVEGVLLPHIPLSEAGGIYASGADDSVTDPADPRGLNGFVPGSQDTQVQLTFDYDNPMHGPQEKLRIGRYYILCVANFHEATLKASGEAVNRRLCQCIAYWQQHQNDPGFSGIPLDAEGDFPGYRPLVQGRILKSDAQVLSWGHPDTQEESEDDVIQSTSYIFERSSRSMAAKAQHLVLHQGYNQASIAPERVVTRYTFRLNNQTNTPVKLRNFTLGVRFASACMYLFNHSDIAPDQVTPNSPNWMGIPDIYSPRCIHPFTNDVVYAPHVGNQVVWDALVFPGADSDLPLTFSLDVELPEQPGYEANSGVYSLISEEMVPQERLSVDMGTVASSANYTRWFLMQCVNKNLNSPAKNRQVFLKAQEVGGQPKAVVDPAVYDMLTARPKVEGTPPDLAFIWGLEKIADSDQVLIRNALTGLYLQVDPNATPTASGQAILTTDDPALATPFDMNNYPRCSKNNGVNTGVEGAVCFEARTQNKDVYLNVLANFSLVSLIDWNDVGSHFKLYEVGQSEAMVADEHLRKQVTIPIHVYDRITGHSYPLHEPRRNQHLQVQINVNWSSTLHELLVVTLAATERDNYVTFD